jgi:hypothetical protein
LIAAFVAGIVVGIVAGSATDKDEELMRKARKEVENEVARIERHKG